MLWTQRAWNNAHNLRAAVRLQRGAQARTPGHAATGQGKSPSISSTSEHSRTPRKEPQPVTTLTQDVIPNRSPGPPAPRPRVTAWETRTLRPQCPTWDFL